MIEHFTKADPDYGSRVSEGLAKAMKEMKNQKNDHTTTVEAKKAMYSAQRKGHKADPY